jgi:uncharacterized membrane protein YbhN (UPF0104 family)
MVTVPLRIVLSPFPGHWTTFVEERFDAFVEGLSPLRDWRVLVVASGLSAAVWTAELLSYVMLSRGVNLGLPPTLEVPALGLALVTINLGIMIPSGPGYVGTMEFFGRAALTAVGANDAAALALILVGHVVQYVLVTGLGLFFFAREHVLPREIRSSLAAEQSL